MNGACRRPDQSMTCKAVLWGCLLRLRTAIVALTLVGLLAETAHADTSRIPTSKGEIQLSFAPLVEKSAPAVVNIFTRKIMRQRQRSPLFDDPFFQRFFGEFGFSLDRQERQPANALGSGVIVSGDGLIVTNLHVIEGADEVRVVLSDRREFEAKVIAADEKTDLAVLRVQAEGEILPHLAFRDSDEVKVGDLVLAIGNPFGVGQTVTSGIVSALSRKIAGPSDIRAFIQTDAAINPGNSGGALISMDGRLVGINTAIFSKSGGSLGIGFAIPSNLVKAVIRGIESGGRLIRPWLGASGQAVTSDIANSLGMARPTGVLINDVYEGASAWQAGLRASDIILAVNGHEVNDPQDLLYRVATLPVGDTVVLRVSKGGATRALRLTLAPPPEMPSRNASDLNGEHPLGGATVANMSPALADEIGLDPFLRGVVIFEIKRGSHAHRSNFRPGDVIAEINRDTIRTVADIGRALKAAGGRWRIEFQREGRSRTLVFQR